MQALAFECPICFCTYNDNSNIPASFPCGHSLCLFHVPSLQQCHVCRKTLPPIDQVNPNFALRDGSIVYYKLLEDIESLRVLCTNQANEIKLANSRKAEKIPTMSLSDFDDTEVDDSTLAQIQQLENDEEFARKLQEEINGIDLNPPRPPTSDEEFSALLNEQLNLIQRAGSVGSPRGQRQEKNCGHTCGMTLDSCCWCSDPREPDCNVFPIYREDRWFEEIMPRDNFYCVECKGKEDRLDRL